MTTPSRRLISFDWAMKRLLRSKAHFGILEGFLSELLRTDIQILEILDSESNKDTAIDKQNRVDLKARNTAGEIIIIEVQYQRQFDYLQRIFHSTAKTVPENLKAGQLYDTLVKVISVSILYFDLGQGKDYVYHGATRFVGMHEHDELQLNDVHFDRYRHTDPYKLIPEYYLIKVNQFNDIARDSLDEWIYFLKNEEVPEKFKAQGLQQAKQQLDILKLSEVERQAYENYQDQLRQQASMVRSSFVLGKEEGREEGQRQERMRIATSLLSIITDDQLLADKTGLSVAEVQGLRLNSTLL